MIFLLSSVYVTAHSTHFCLHYLGSKIFRPTYRWYSAFSDENLFLSMKMCFCFDVKYYPKQIRYFSYAMIIATTFTVCLTYQHYRNTRLVQFLVIALIHVRVTCFFLLFLFFLVFFCLCFFPCCCCFFYCKTPRSPLFLMTRFIYIFIFCILFQCYCVQVSY